MEIPSTTDRKPLPFVATVVPALVVLNSAGASPFAFPPGTADEPSVRPRGSVARHQRHPAIGVVRLARSRCTAARNAAAASTSSESAVSVFTRRARPRRPLPLSFNVSASVSCLTYRATSPSSSATYARNAPRASLPRGAGIQALCAQKGTSARRY